MQSLEYKGFWWLPENPDKKIAGILRFQQPDSPILELIGEQFTTDIYRSHSPEFILGLSESTYITLYKCLSKSMGWVSSYLAHVVFVNAHFEKEEEMIFDNMSVSYFNLEEWARNEETYQLLKAEDFNMKQIAAELKIDDLYLKIRFSVDKSLRLSETSEKLRAHVQIEKRLHFNDYMRKILHYIEIFLSMGINNATYPLSLTGKTSTAKKVSWSYVKIYYAIPGNLIEDAKIIYHQKMFLTLSDIVDNFEEHLENWLLKSERLAPVYNLFFQVLQAKSYLEHEFLQVAKAVEAYHRRTYQQSGTYMGSEDYEIVRDSLVKQLGSLPLDVKIDDKVKKRIESSLRAENINDFTLRDRLKEIWKTHQDAIKVFIPSRKQYDQFTDEVIIARDFLTHYFENPDIEAKLTPQYLIELIQNLKYIMQICLLYEMGILPNKIQEFIKREIQWQPQNQH